MKLCMIVAMSRNRVIGRDGQMPWRLPQDLRRFKELTMGHPIIMGRKTHESIGRVLPGRLNVVLTRNPRYASAGTMVFNCLDAALAQLSGEHDQAFIIGGAAVYRQALPLVQRIYLTLIKEDVKGDTFFPQLPANTFSQTARQSHQSPMPHSFITLDRR